MSDKSRLRQIKGSKRAPVEVPVEVPEPLPYDPGPHRIPVVAGHPDTELHLVSDDGRVVATVRLMDLTIETSNQGSDVTARFRGMEHFASYRIPGQIKDHEGPHIIAFGRTHCSLCGEDVI